MLNNCCFLLINLASKRTQSLLDFRHIIPSQITLPPMRSKTPVTDLDAPDGPSSENQQTFNNMNDNNNNTNNNNSNHINNNGNINNNHHMNGFVNHSNNVRDSYRSKTSIPTVQNKTFSNDEEKHSVVGDPIYQTISSEKGAKLGRNCISLENLRTLTIKNDLNSYGNNLLQNQNGNPSSPYYILPTFPPNPSYHASHYFPHKPNPFMYGPAIPQHPFPMQPVHHMMAHQPATYFHNYRAPFTNYGGYTNPNP